MRHSSNKIFCVLKYCLFHGHSLPAQGAGDFALSLHTKPTWNSAVFEHTLTTPPAPLHPQRCGAKAQALGRSCCTALWCAPARAIYNSELSLVVRVPPPLSSRMRVAVTGSYGLLGRAIVQYLELQGHEVRASSTTCGAVASCTVDDAGAGCVSKPKREWQSCLCGL
jgi:hypothetical protein